MSDLEEKILNILHEIARSNGDSVLMALVQILQNCRKQNGTT